MQKNHIISYAQEWRSHEKLYMNTDKVYKLDLLVTLYCKKSWETGLCSRSARAPQRTNFCLWLKTFTFFLHWFGTFGLLITFLGLQPWERMFVYCGNISFEYASQSEGSYIFTALY